MKIQSEIQTLSPARAGAQSFYLFTLNSNGAFQRYLVPDRFDSQMHVGTAKGLLLYDHPAHLVADALAEGTYNDAALRQWIGEAEQHLDIVRRLRRKMLVIERGATNETVATAAFNGAFGGCKPPAEFAPAAQSAPVLYSLISLFAVRQFRPVAQLLSELEASSIAPGPDEPIFEDSLALIARELSELSANVPFEERQANKNSLESSNRELRRRNEELEQKAHLGIAETNKILVQQVLDLQTCLQEIETKSVVEEAAKTALKNENAALKKSIDLIHKSTSWRVTTPVRAIKGVFTR